MIKYLSIITRPLAQQYPRTVFIFGDNLKRAGLGGLAHALRGEPNAIGIVTKRFPSMARDAFFTGTEAEWIAVDKDLQRVFEAVENGRDIYAPYYALGTGLAELPERVPDLYNHIVRFFRMLPGEPCPWAMVRKNEPVA